MPALLTSPFSAILVSSFLASCRFSMTNSFRSFCFSAFLLALFATISGLAFFWVVTFAGIRLYTGLPTRPAVFRTNFSETPRRCASSRAFASERSFASRLSISASSNHFLARFGFAKFFLISSTSLSFWVLVRFGVRMILFRIAVARSVRTRSLPAFFMVCSRALLFAFFAACAFESACFSSAFASRRSLIVSARTSLPSF